MPKKGRVHFYLYILEMVNTYILLKFSCVDLETQGKRTPILEKIITFLELKVISIITSIIPLLKYNSLDNLIFYGISPYLFSHEIPTPRKEDLP